MSLKLPSRINNTGSQHLFPPQVLASAFLFTNSKSFPSVGRTGFGVSSEASPVKGCAVPIGEVSDGGGVVLTVGGQDGLELVPTLWVGKNG